MASGNWIVDNLNNALNTWNDKLNIVATINLIYNTTLMVEA